ncbi:MAG: hypothetical protein KAI24_03275 [Planctomycetes bacterium]|nr:hypothetical protein [Planctomycetota bacterium]
MRGPAVAAAAQDRTTVAAHSRGVAVLASATACHQQRSREVSESVRAERDVAPATAAAASGIATDPETVLPPPADDHLQRRAGRHGDVALDPAAFAAGAVYPATRCTLDDDRQHRRASRHDERLDPVGRDGIEREGLALSGRGRRQQHRESGRCAAGSEFREHGRVF